MRTYHPSSSSSSIFSSPAHLLVSIAIIPSQLSEPVRSYPLPTINKPAVYVMGEKRGPVVTGPQQQQQPPPGMGGGGGGMGPGAFSTQAMLAAQNSNLEALERRRERERGRDRSTSMAMAGVSVCFFLYTCFHDSILV
jgi:hypothetical protein